MSDKLTCPECQHDHAIPAAGTRKIDCSGCGMIIVIRKVLGDGWESNLSKPSPAAGAGKAPVIRSRRTKSRDAEANGETAEAPAERPKSKGSSRRSSRTSGRKAKPHVEAAGSISSRHSHHSANNGPPMGIMLGSLGIIIVAGVVGGYFWSQSGGDTPETVDTTADSTELDENGIDSAGNDMAAGDNGTTSSNPGDEKTAAVKGEGGGETTAAVKEDKKPKARSKKSKRAPLVMTAFEASDGTTEEQTTEIKGYIETLKDLNATRKLFQAQDKLVAMPKASIPFLINAMNDLDYSDQDDAKRGWNIIQALAIASARDDDYNDYWKDAMFNWADEGEEGHASNAKWRRKNVERWYKWWTKVGAEWKPAPPEDG